LSGGRRWIGPACAVLGVAHDLRFGADPLTSLVFVLLVTLAPSRAVN